MTELLLMDPFREMIVASMRPEDRVSFLAILFRAAQADLVSRQERDRLQPVADWMHATPGELDQAMKTAYDTTQELRDLVRALQGDKGLLLFREACAVVWVDGTKSAEEAKFLEQLSGILGLTDSTKRVLDTPQRLGHTVVP